jgi:hypothetical protein
VVGWTTFQPALLAPFSTVVNSLQLDRQRTQHFRQPAGRFGIHGRIMLQRRNPVWDGNDRAGAGCSTPGLPPAIASRQAPIATFTPAAEQGFPTGHSSNREQQSDHRNVMLRWPLGRSSVGPPINRVGRLDERGGQCELGSAGGAAQAGLQNHLPRVPAPANITRVEITLTISTGSPFTSGVPCCRRCTASTRTRTVTPRPPRR